MQFNRPITFSLLALAILLGMALSASAQTSPRPVSLGILDFGDTPTGRRASETLAANLKTGTDVSILDRDQVGVAARATGYSGSINLSLDDARRLGATIGSDFFIIGDAQTLRRSPSSGPVYFESYASVFLVSARSGRLVAWTRPMFEAATAAGAEDALVAKLNSAETRNHLISALNQAHVKERGERELSQSNGVPVIEEAPDDQKIAEAEGLRLPRPYRRLTPPYPESAAKAEVEAVVDVLVDLDAEGEVTRVEVARWAGFGLDESTVETVRRLHFFPAKRNGVSVPLRVLLRYNFRKPPRE